MKPLLLLPYIEVTTVSYGQPGPREGSKLFITGGGGSIPSSSILSGDGNDLFSKSLLNRGLSLF